MAVAACVTRRAAMGHWSATMLSLFARTFRQIPGYMGPSVHEVRPIARSQSISDHRKTQVKQPVILFQAPFAIVQMF